LLVAGNRRLAACRLARLDVVPCIIRRDQLTAADIDALMFVENVHRKGLSAIEKAEALGRMRKTRSLVTVAYMTGLAPSTVSRYLALLDLDESTRERVRAGNVPVGDALAAVRAGHPATWPAERQPHRRPA
jgi:ParB family chromosome partitioning protein